MRGKENDEMLQPFSVATDGDSGSSPSSGSPIEANRRVGEVMAMAYVGVYQWSSVASVVVLFNQPLPQLLEPAVCLDDRAGAVGSIVLFPLAAVRKQPKRDITLRYLSHLEQHQGLQ